MYIHHHHCRVIIKTNNSDNIYKTPKSCSNLKVTVYKSLLVALCLLLIRGSTLRADPLASSAEHEHSRNVFCV